MTIYEPAALRFLEIPSIFWWLRERERRQGLPFSYGSCGAMWNYWKIGNERLLCLCPLSVRRISGPGRKERDETAERLYRRASRRRIGWQWAGEYQMSGWFGGCALRNALDVRAVHTYHVSAIALQFTCGSFWYTVSSKAHNPCGFKFFSWKERCYTQLR